MLRFWSSPSELNLRRAAKNRQSDAVRNVAASKALVALFDDAAWLNVHHLPHDIYVFELRDKHGYGARWLANDPRATFRGFVEPPMEGGHDKGWRH